MITKQEILNKTHYGLNIYSYILRQYYPGETVLSLSGRDCQPTKNPFNADKTTLLIKVKDGCAIHTDLEKAIPHGDAFNFAEKYFKLKDQPLLDKLNQVLHLRIENQQKLNIQIDIDTEEKFSVTTNLTTPVFSYFQKPIKNTLPSKQTSLVEIYKLIKGNDFKENTNKLRNITDPKNARTFKANNFDYVTFSGIFSKRNEANLQNHSGLLTIDFDKIKNIENLKETLLNDQYFDTELMFTSPSGDGLKWVIPIELTQVKHQDYFRAVANYIQYTYSIEIDGSGKDISRACFLPHDPNVFINPKYL